MCKKIEILNGKCKNFMDKISQKNKNFEITAIILCREKYRITKNKNHR